MEKGNIHDNKKKLRPLQKQHTYIRIIEKNMFICFYQQMGAFGAVKL